MSTLTTTTYTMTQPEPAAADAAAIALGPSSGETARTFTAACLSGKNQYKMTGLPLACVVCHCTTCRRHSGAPYLHTAAWLNANVEQTAGGGADDVVSNSHTDALVRRACKHCGGVVASETPAYGLTALHLGCIEDAYEGNTHRAVFKPQCHLFYGSRVADVIDGAPKMAKKAPADGMLPETL